MQRLSAAIVCGGLLLFLGGCGKTPIDQDGVKVTGSVTMGGQPQVGVRVGFIPDPPSTERPSRGAATNAEGKFEVKAHPGKYKVTLSKMVDQSGNVPGDSEDASQDYAQLEASGALREAFPPQYADPMSTPVSADIPPEGKDLEPFVVGM